MTDERGGRPPSGSGQPAQQTQQPPRKQRRQQDQGAGGHAPTTSPWEHAVAALGVVVVVAAVGFMLYQALSERGKPVPRVTIQVDTVAPYSAGHVVQIIARNEGGATATNVLIEGALRADTGLVEKSQTTVDFVPAWLAAEGGPLLHEGPRAIPPGNPPARVRPTLRLLFHLERIQAKIPLYRTPIIYGERLRPNGSSSCARSDHSVLTDTHRSALVKEVGGGRAEREVRARRRSAARAQCAGAQRDRAGALPRIAVHRPQRRVGAALAPLHDAHRPVGLEHHRLHLVER